MREEHWSKEEFEEIITKAMIAIYDYNWNFEFPLDELRPSKRFSEQDWNFIKKRGLYFAPHDRYMDPNGIDIRNDGLPDYGMMTLNVNPNEVRENFIKDYLRHFVFKKITKVPPPYILTGFGTKYMVHVIAVRPEGGCVYGKTPVIISANGIILPCDEMVWNGVRMVREVVKRDDPEHYELFTTGTACAFSYWADRKHLWNITATDGNHQAMFGVYPSEVKSLFYSRAEPLTGTGRLRPILHWVRSHRRRLKKGIDIDIEKHLRGTNSFIWDGYEFKIDRPLKGKEDRNGSSQQKDRGNLFARARSKAPGLLRR